MEGSILPSAPRVAPAYQPVVTTAVLSGEWWEKSGCARSPASVFPAGIPLFCSLGGGVLKMEKVAGSGEDVELVSVSPERNLEYTQFFGVLSGAVSVERCTQRVVSVTMEGEVTLSVDPDGTLSAVPYTWHKLVADAGGRTFYGTCGIRAMTLTSSAPADEKECFLLSKGRRPYNEARVYISSSKLF